MVMLMSPQWRVASNVTKQWSVTPVIMGSYPPAMSPTLGAKFQVVAGLPPHSGGVAHALGPWQWTNNSTDLLGIK